MQFCEIDSEERMRLWDHITEHGGDVVGYAGPCVQVAMPYPILPFLDAMASEFTPVREWDYFPLGSDNPRQSLRHDGNYPDSKGFWAYVNLTPRNPIA